MSEPHSPALGTPPDRSDNLLRHYVGVLRRRWRWIALGLAVGLLAGVLAAALTKDEPVTTRYYKATNTLTVGAIDPGDGTVTPTGGDYTLNQAALLIQSQQLKEEVAAATGTSPGAIAEQVEAVVRPNVNAIDVTAIATDPQHAAQLADTSADALRLMARARAGDSAADQRTQLEDALQQIEDEQRELAADADQDEPGEQLLRSQRIRDLEAQADSLRHQLDALPEETGFNLTVLAPATPTQINGRGYEYRRTRNINARNELADTTRTSASNPDFDELDLSTTPPVAPRTRVLLGGAAGLLLGLIAAFVIEAWDDRVRRRDQVEQLTGLGVLTEVPELSREQIRDHHVAVSDEPTGIAAERYRSARTAIDFAMGENPTTLTETPVIMVTSPGPAEGKTTTAVNLAATFADDGKRVLVVDGDFRRPAVRRYLTPTPNLVAPDEPQQTRIGPVAFLPGPTAAATPEAAIGELNELIARWRGAYDLVILDTPPILTTNDAVGLLISADAVVLVLRAGRTRPRATARVAELLRQYRADVYGVVLNEADRTEMNEYYGYGFGYHYGNLGETPRGDRTAPATGTGTATDRSPADPEPGGPAPTDATNATRAPRQAQAHAGERTAR